MEKCCPRICSLVFGRSFLRPAKMVELRTSRFTAPSADQKIDLGNFRKSKKIGIQIVLSGIITNLDDLFELETGFWGKLCAFYRLFMIDM